MANQLTGSKRLIVVSNRLPFIASEEEGELRFRKSSGGLVTGLSSFLRSIKGEYIWVGWPGAEPEGEGKERLRQIAMERYNSYPVFFAPELMDKFYRGFCNSTIWPLFHYFPALTSYHEEHWATYKEVNEIFCQAILEILKPDDILWIHDYHLLLLPGLVRRRRPEQAIGFFLHIPFPSFEVFRLLPRQWGNEILEGLLGADLIGFHTHDYTQYFLRNVLRILGYEHNLGQIMLQSRTVKADTFPMGIEYSKFQNALQEPDVREEKEDLLKTLANFKLVFSVDRLDYTKGILNRLEGYEHFLEENPEWRGKMVFVLVVVPSRIGVDHYQQMKTNIDSMVGKINGKFGDVAWTPIVYQFHTLEFPRLAALYSLSDIALITPLRDGMNLVAKEYIASRTDRTGVLILSEMAGAAKELGEAIIINPNHKEDIARALKEAAEMPLDEQGTRLERMQARLRAYDIFRWAEDFLEGLDKIKDDQKKFEARFINSFILDKIKQNYLNAKHRFIFLDYDGTLIPFARSPHEARPDNDLLRLLQSLGDDPANRVVLISGRDRAVLDEWFENLPLGFVAEHGAWIKEKGGSWKLLKPLNSEWKHSLYPILKAYADRLPGAFIEAKEHSLVWHYRQADPEYAPLRAKELLDHITDFTANIDVQVLRGSKVIEIRNSGVTKGNAALMFLLQMRPDFILALGDDWTDEDLFRAMPDMAFTIRVGRAQSVARYNVRDFRGSRNLLREIISSTIPKEVTG